jgi:hypothetical protein
MKVDRSALVTARTCRQTSARDVPEAALALVFWGSSTASATRNLLVSRFGFESARLFFRARESLCSRTRSQWMKLAVVSFVIAVHPAA